MDEFDYTPTFGTEAQVAKSGARLVRGREARAAIARLKNPKGGKGVNVGVVKTARHQTGTLKGRPDRTTPPYIAEVAFWNEFGTRGGGWGGPIPSRPFMRLSVRQYLTDPIVKALIKKLIDPTNPILSARAAELLGVKMADIMKENFHNPTIKPNAPATVMIKTKGKGGNTTPLIDEAILINAISYMVD